MTKRERISPGGGQGESRTTGRVILIGAGPGDPDLITLRGAKALGRADVVLFDQLATGDLLDLAPERAERINVGKRGHEEPTRSQEDINALIVDRALAGRTVVRLKGGDPFVFGRGGEELSACAAAGIPFEVVPGVSSAIASAAYAGIPVTDRRHAASFAVVTGHKDPTRVSEQTRWRELGAAVDTLVILMGMRNLPKIVEELIAGGKPPDTPAAIVMHGTLPGQRSCVSTLVELPAAAAEAGLSAPSTILIGGVVGLRDEMAWWEDQPLFGKRVLVTRAQEQAAEICGALRAAGAMPVLRPMIELRALETEAERAEIDRVLGEIEAYRVWVFTSSNAARFFARALLASRPASFAGPVVPPGVRVFCVGDATARAALDAGFPVHVIASGRGDAEALLGQLLPALPGAGERVLIPRSQIGRTVIADGLRKAGAIVDSIAFYENSRPAIDEEGLRAALIADELDALTFTSPSTVDHFVACLDVPSRAAATRCMIAAIGRTTEKRLAHHGFEAQVVPDRPEVALLVDGMRAASSSKAFGK